MENVPELQWHPIFDRFLATLKDTGFHCTEDREKQIVYCPDYGIPQVRQPDFRRFRGVSIFSETSPGDWLGVLHESSARRRVGRPDP
jgi:site-specific DNA-cytosine methylase